MATWREKHPSWEYKLWTEKEAYALGMRNALLFTAFDKVFHAQADVLRYEILHKYGGVYVDADSECLRPIDDVLLDSENFACLENDHDPPLIMNSFLGAVPSSALFGAVINELQMIDIDAVLAEDRDTLYKIAWVLTGPGCFSEVVHRDRYTIALHPKHFFASHGEPGLYGRHWLGSTNRSYSD